MHSDPPCNRWQTLVMRRSGVQIPEAAQLSSPGTSLTPVPGLCLLSDDFLCGLVGLFSELPWSRN